ncbi:MAG: hypothetical protein U0234_01950 [Sandaracinus sp.]
MRIAYLLLLLVGCSSAAPLAGEDASAPDASAPDAGMAFDAGCLARVSQVVGPEGATLEHCDGARVVVPPGALASPTELFLERVVDPPSIVAPYVLAGPAFELGPAGTTFAGRVEVSVPHGGGERMEMAVLVDGAWQVVEVCRSDATHVTQSFGGAGRFVAAHDPTVYPPGPGGLGTGAVDYTLGGVDGAPDRTDHLEIEYAIDEQIGEGESLTLVFRRSDAAGLVQIDLRLAVAADGTVEPVQLAWADTGAGEIWDVIAFLHPGELQIVTDSRAGRALSGTVTATLHLGDRMRSLSATFRATSVEWRYPPERICDMPQE